METSTDVKRLREAFRAAGQEQVFRFWDGLNAEERAQLAAEAAEVDLDEVAHLVKTLVLKTPVAMDDFSGLAPAPVIALPEHGGNEAEWAEAKLAGEEALRAGKVAAFTVAGGQGTRLGFAGPKGLYPATPVKEKSLFQVFAEKLRSAERRYGCRLPWLIMTSHLNHEETEAFFRKNRYFGLDAEQVRFFRQGRMPAVDFEGRILLAGRASIALSPDGHGGSLRALKVSGSLDWLESLGIEVISYFQVDNPLVQCIDPEFIGFHLRSGSEMSSKMIPKAYPDEKVGNFCLHHGKLVVIEYSDLPKALEQRTEPDGSLSFRAGSIAIHLLSTRFVRSIGGGKPGLVLPFHRANKKVETVDDAGKPLVPADPNGIKFELFVFDALPFAQNPIVVETAREREFSPIKNKEGVDSAESSRRDQVRLFARWLRLAGVDVRSDAAGEPTLQIEVSPLFATSESEFLERWQGLETKPAVTDPFYLE
ncbi:MAG: UDPGP type 1 family protein [Puniceicoccaceae bacterium]|nr:MAG: UDPGP type 1 family protein [Puniceicoccaceae bacterium]